MKLSLLANDKSKLGFDAEHGLSIYVEHPLYNILFDTGYTSIYLDNAKKLGINFEELNYIVLSHGHYDHTGGLLYYPPDKNLNSIIVHRDAFVPKYARNGLERYNGIPYSKNDLLWAIPLYYEVRNFSEIAPRFYVIGDITHDIDHNKFFVNDKLDDFHDELIMVLIESDELSIFMGCSHYGQEYFPNKRIKNLIAGMHLGSKSIIEIQEIANYIESIEIQRIIPLHCTGDVATQIFKDRFQEKCIIIKAGDQIEI